MFFPFGTRTLGKRHQTVFRPLNAGYSEVLLGALNLGRVAAVSFAAEPFGLNGTEGEYAWDRKEQLGSVPIKGLLERAPAAYELKPSPSRCGVGCDFRSHPGAHRSSPTCRLGGLRCPPVR